MSRRPWYESAFGADYPARYAHRDAAEARAAVALLDGAVGGVAGRRVFDLCCGAGRHLAALRAAGALAVGGDLSAALLALARRGGARVVRLDMRRLPWRAGAFDIVTNFFTAFGYFDDDHENMAVLAGVARVLRPGGWFLLDYINAIPVMAGLTVEPSVQVQQGPDGRHWRTTRWLAPGPRAEKRMVALDDPAGAEVAESLRLYRREELEAGLRAAGLDPVAAWGDYTGRAAGGDAPRLILLARRLSDEAAD
jgi:SAM-dependent methyltransferase